MESFYERSINWRIGSNDDDMSANVPWQVRWIVSTGSTFPACRVEESGEPQEPIDKNPRCPAYVGGIPAWRPKVFRAYSEIAVEQRFTPGTLPDEASVPAERMIGRERVQLQIDGAGKLASCKTLYSEGVMPPQLPRGCSISAKGYVPARNSDGTPIPFSAQFEIAVYGVTTHS